jgi:protein-disulfide isomerase
VVALVLAPLFSPVGGAQQAEDRRTTDERRLIQELKHEILEELRSGDFLHQQIELGIKEYLQNEQAARIATAAERTRLASEKVRNVRRVSGARDHIYGNPDAAISLIEYSDFECPFCKRFHATPKEIVDASAGQINWVYRHFPLAMHNPGARKQAEAAECAGALGGNDAFWKYTEAIYLRTRSRGNGFPLTELTPLATEIGLQAERFQECLDSGKYAARVQEDLAEGATIGVTGTPTTVLLHNRTGDARLEAGVQSAARFKTDIDMMLK